MISQQRHMLEGAIRQLGFGIKIADLSVNAEIEGVRLIAVMTMKRMGGIDEEENCRDRKSDD